MRAASCVVFTSNRSGCCSECRCMSPFASHDGEEPHAGKHRDRHLRSGSRDRSAAFTSNHRALLSAGGRASIQAAAAKQCRQQGERGVLSELRWYTSWERSFPPNLNYWLIRFFPICENHKLLLPPLKLQTVIKQNPKTCVYNNNNDNSLYPWYMIKQH